tara:strand:- start:1016 stop:1132 length:117 start_codon:yes stop_codon:yes gene_type:complete
MDILSLSVITLVFMGIALLSSILVKDRIKKDNPKGKKV